MTTAADTTASQVPDAVGRFGAFGGRYVPETLIRALDELAVEYDKARVDPAFQRELADLLKNYVGRPSPLYFAKRLSQQCGGAQIWLKREDLNHTGAHKINNTIGQALLTLRMGKRRVIAETGAGQHGVATATACAHFGLECVVYMGEEDIRRQAPNVFSMKLLGTEVRPVSSGSRTLRDAINEAMRDWMSSVETTHYILGSVVGPHPFPRIVRDFQSVIGRETIEQSRSQLGRLPDTVVACVGGGSNAAGMFYPLVEHSEVALVGVEAGGRSERPGDHAAPLTYGRPGVLARQLQLRDAGQRRPDVRRPLDVGRARLPGRRAGAQLLEGHAAASRTPIAATPTPWRRSTRWPAARASWPRWKARTRWPRRCNWPRGKPQEHVIVVCLSGRGDKDAAEIARLTGQSG